MHIRTHAGKKKKIALCYMIKHETLEGSRVFDEILMIRPEEKKKDTEGRLLTFSAQVEVQFMV